MIFPKIKLTDAGKRLIAASLLGDTITFTQFKLGKGDPASLSPVALDDPVISVPFTDYERGTASVMLTGSFDNADLRDGFNATELGVFAQGNDGIEVLYAYAYESEHPAYIPAYSSTSFMRTTLNITVAIGDAQNVTAIIGNVMGFVTSVEFNAHLDATNPHNISKSTVGLGLVPNVAPENREIPFSAVGRLSELISGEKLNSLIAKCAAAVSSYMQHSNSTNPHRTSYSDVGAAPSNHTHYARNISDIDAWFTQMVVTGSYTGNGAAGRTVTLDFTPRAVIILPAQSLGSGNRLGDNAIVSGLAVKNVNVIIPSASTAYFTAWDDRYCAIGLATNGFKVNFNSQNDIATNANGMTYTYIALK